MSHLFVGVSRLGIFRTNSFIINDITSKWSIKQGFSTSGDIMQGMFVFCYRRFGSTYRPQIQRSISRSIIVPNYHPALPEQRTSQLYQDGSLVLHRKEDTWGKEIHVCMGFRVVAFCDVKACSQLEEHQRFRTSWRLHRLVFTTLQGLTSKQIFVVCTIRNWNFKRVSIPNQRVTKIFFCLQFYHFHFRYVLQLWYLFSKLPR
jgi:hypothetical protein